MCWSQTCSSVYIVLGLLIKRQFWSMKNYLEMCYGYLWTWEVESSCFWWCLWFAATVFFEFQTKYHIIKPTDCYDFCWAHSCAQWDPLKFHSNNPMIFLLVSQFQNVCPFPGKSLARSKDINIFFVLNVESNKFFVYPNGYYFKWFFCFCFVFSVFTVIENGTALYHQPERKPDDLPVRNQFIKLFHKKHI